MRSPGRSVVGTVDPLQVQASLSLAFAEPLELFCPGLPVQEWYLALAQLTATSSPPDDSAEPGSSSPSVPEDLKAYQDLLWHVVTSLDLQSESLQKYSPELLDILQPSPLGRVNLPINDVFLEPTKVL